VTYSCSCVVSWMAAGRHGKGALAVARGTCHGKRGHLPSPGKCTGSIRFSYNVLIRTKRTKIVSTRHLSLAQNIPKCVWGWSSAPDLAGGLTMLPQTDSLAEFKGALCNGEEKAEWRGWEWTEGSMREDKGEEGWRAKGGGRLPPPLQELLWAPMVSCIVC